MSDARPLRFDGRAQRQAPMAPRRDPESDFLRLPKTHTVPAECLLAVEGRLLGW